MSSTFPGPSACRNGIVVPDPSTNSSLVSDFEALLSALTVKNGQYTSVPLDWSASEPLTTEWEGITTGDGTSSWLRGEVVQRITGLNLSNRSLSETLNIDWEEVATLDALETLDMSGNGFSGSIPERFHLLNHLQHLRLANNNLTGDIPQQLERLTNLRTLSLYDNNLTGQIPNGLGELRTLSTVLLSDNGFGGVLPPAFGNTNIIHLDLSNNLIGGPVPVQYGQLTNVTHLDLSNNQLSGEIPKELSNLTSLQSVYLSGNSFIGCVPKEAAAALGQASSHDLAYLNITICYAPLIDLDPPNGGGWKGFLGCVGIKDTSMVIEGSKITKIDQAGGVHEFWAEVEYVRPINMTKYHCVTGKLINESTPGAASIEWGGALYKSEAVWLGIDVVAAISNGSWSALFTFYDYPVPDRDGPSYSPEQTYSCNYCRGGTVRTHTVLTGAERYLKHENYYVYGEHTLTASSGETLTDSDVEDTTFETTASWQVPAKPITSKADLPGLAIELAVDILEEPLALLIQWIASFFRDK